MSNANTQAANNNADNDQNEFSSKWYLSAMEQLVSVVQELSHARDLPAVTAIVREAARSLTGADGATFVLRDGDQCYYAEENAIAPLWKGKRFPMSACVSGWVMNNARSAVIEDIYTDPRVPTDAYRPTFVKSLAMVPIRRESPIGAIGNYWAAKRLPTKEEVSILQALADTTSVALENAELYNKLQQQVKTLQQQQEYIQSQHNALEVFTRALAHDLKEPVRTMISFTRMIEEDEAAPEKKQTYFHYIQNAANRMGMLIDSVFHYTQLDDLSQITRETCHMDDVFNGAKENLAALIQESGAEVSALPLPQVNANPTHMIQVVQNIIANAIRHNKNKITVQIQAKERENDWLFSIKDNGVGIAKQHIEKIFLPFKRLSHNEECSGLGLAICHKIITSYGGNIWCESSPGQGAIFLFTLPKSQQQSYLNTSTATFEQKDKETLNTEEGLLLANVLLVDDREDDIELTKVRLLERAEMKCNVLVAYDGEEAHEILKEKHPGQDGIDLILLDINMPSMDGFELLELMRKDTALKDISVVMCSGSTYEPDIRRAQSLGAVGYLVKPASFEKLKPILEGISTLRLHQEGKFGKLMRNKGTAE